ncbi:peptidase S8 [Roseibium sp. RKSG952]|nr:peptidase S8 [Roseibium sp. RKSG952]
MRNLPLWVGMSAILFTVSACNGGGSTGTSDVDDTSSTETAEVIEVGSCDDGTGASGTFDSSCVTSFDESVAESISRTAEFQAQTRTVSSEWTGLGDDIESNAYSDINLQYARSVGLTGAGQTISIVDEGFLLSHDELDGKNITLYGGNNAADHGTYVATIAAGEEDGSGTMGVASGADLHLTAWDDGTGSDAPLSYLAAATLDAAAIGAVVQNNSWTYVYKSNDPNSDDVTITLSHFNEAAAVNPTLSSEEILGNSVTGSASDWADYISSLETFAMQGVIVFAQSNNESDTSASVMAALPEIFPELEGSWAVAVNGVPEYDSSGNISEVHRVSAGCLETAAYCLTANGFTYGGTASTDSSYSFEAGTSFAAPQISGSVALLAEAFPSLPASDLLDRLFASANNTFFTSTDEVDFGNGVTHGYNEEFGHGFLDLKAALLPIGSVGVPTSNNAYDGVTSLASVSITSGSAHGNALSNALSGKTMAVYDSLGADFEIDADAIIGSSSDDLGERLASFRSVGAADRASAMSYSFMDNGLAVDTGGFRFMSGPAGEIGGDLGFMQSGKGLFSGDSSIMSHSAGTMAFATVRKRGGRGFSAMTFVERDDADEIASAGFGFSAARSMTPRLTTVLGFTANGENGTALGMSAEDLDDDTLSATSSALTLSGEWAHSRRLSFFANAEFGLTAANGAGYLESLEPSMHTAFGSGIKVHEIFSDQDRLTFMLRQPLRVEQGSGTLRLPSGRTQDGTITYASYDVGLVPEARQIDMGLRYDFGHRDATSFGLGGVVSFNEGHASGETGASALFSFRHLF